jgi:hypothetical protein
MSYRSRGPSSGCCSRKTDFGELVFRREREVPGVVLMRLAPENAALKVARLAAAIERYGNDLFGRYMVIDDARLRSRRL